MSERFRFILSFRRNVGKGYLPDSWPPHLASMNYLFIPSFPISFPKSWRSSPCSNSPENQLKEVENLNKTQSLFLDQEAAGKVPAFSSLLPKYLKISKLFWMCQCTWTNTFHGAHKKAFSASIIYLLFLMWAPLCCRSLFTWTFSCPLVVLSHPAFLVTSWHSGSLSQLCL